MRGQYMIPGEAWLDDSGADDGQFMMPGFCWLHLVRSQRRPQVLIMAG